MEDEDGLDGRREEVYRLMSVSLRTYEQVGGSHAPWFWLARLVLDHRMARRWMYALEFSFLVG